MKAIIIITIIIVTLLVFDSCWNIFVNNRFPHMQELLKDFAYSAIVAGIIFLTAFKVNDGLLIQL